MIIPIAPLIGLMPAVMSTVNAAKVSPQLAGIQFVRVMTGVDINNRKMDFKATYSGLLPLVLGMAIHRYVGGAMGFNRMFSRAKLPFSL
jgi:hypothetical protein